MSGFHRRRTAILGACVLVASAASVVASASASASAPDKVHVVGKPIEGSYIVVFANSGTSKAQVRGRADGLTKAHGGKIKYYYDAGLRGYAAAMSATQAAKVAADPSVAYVEQDSVASIDDTEVNPPSWGLDRIDQRQLPLDNSYTYPTTASNVTAYVIDTGILTTHEDFGSRASVGVDEVGDGQDGQDCNGHGTHVAGTLGGTQYGVAKGVRLVAVRVFNCSGSGATSTVIEGINWVTANAVKPAVANMSLGGGFSDAANAAVQAGIDAGVTFVVAAGNTTQDACLFSPGSLPAAITVAATNIADAEASYSNYGTCVDVFAPGTDITSDWDTSDTATNTISGTSMATPHVAGAAALYLGLHPKATPKMVAFAIARTSTRHVITSVHKKTSNRLLYIGAWAS